MPLSLGQCASLACALEATAPKVGNVHRSADFEDASFADFLVSAIAIAPAFDAAEERGVGATVLAAVDATRRLVPHNTNLGMVLLLAPLAAVPRGEPLRSGVADVLSRLTPADSRDVYAAIRLAQPGGLGEAEEMDVRGAAPDDLLAAMRSAASRDQVAEQYATGFALVLAELAPALIAAAARWSLTEAIVWHHVRLIADHGDSLIERKCGVETLGQAREFAQAVLAVGQPGDSAYYGMLEEFDFWLRTDGHRRNPGATADLIAAALFAALRDDQLPPPWK